MATKLARGLLNERVFVYTAKLLNTENTSTTVLGDILLVVLPTESISGARKNEISREKEERKKESRKKKQEKIKARTIRQQTPRISPRWQPP